jgi:hypothetical protein
MRTLHLSLALITASLLALAPRTASAAEDTPEASKTGKGITGGALLGGEVVMLTEAAFKVKPAWAYAIGGLAGAVGGGVGGYFIENGASDAKVPMYMLAGGMALIIPTTVAVLSASAYEPPGDYTEDKAPSDEPVAEPPHAGPAPGGAAEALPPQPAAPESRRAVKRRHIARFVAPPPAPYIPPALLDVGKGRVALSIPSVEVRQVYSRADLMQYGVKQATEVRVPVVNFLF